MSVDERRNLFVTRLSLAALLVAPLVVRDQFLIDRLGGMLLLALIAVSLDLLWGYGGVLSLGHAFVVGTAGYLVALTTTGRIGPELPTVLAVFGGGIAAAMVAALITWIGFRGRRPLGTLEFALLTLSLGVLGEQAASRSELLGGRNGIVLTGRISVGALDLHRGTSFYVLAACLLVAGIITCRWFLRSGLGQVLIAARDDPERVELLGLNVRLARVIAAGVAGGLAGLAGGLLHVHDSIITPSALGLGSSTTILLWVLLGGRGTLIGPVIATVALSSVSIMLAGALLDGWLIVVGVLLVVAVIVLPSGLMGLLQQPERWSLQRDRRS